MIIPSIGVIAALIAAAFTLREITRQGGIGANGVIALLLCAAPTLTITISAVTGARTAVSDGEGGVTFLAVENWAISNIAKFAVIAAAVVLAIINAQRRGIQNPAMLLTAGAAVCAMFGSGLAGYSLFDTRTATMALLFAAFAFIQGGRRLDLSVTLFVLLLIGLSCVLWLANPALATLDCRSYKCGPLGVLVVGVFNNENQLALPVALGAVFAARALRGAQRAYVLILLLSFVYVTGSRTSTVGLAIYVGVSVLCLYVFKRQISLFVAYVIGAIAMTAALILPVTNEDPLILTGRGRLWDAALQLFHSSPLVGVGIYPWRDLVANGIMPTNAGANPSNVWMDTLMVGGVLGSALAIAGLTVSFVRGSPTDRYHLASAAILIGAIGLAESTLVYADLSSPYAFFIPLLITGIGAKTRTSAPTESLSNRPLRHAA